MNYFDELLNSYQLIKKRKFRVSSIVEQEGQYPNISAALSFIQTLPIAKKGAAQQFPLQGNASIVAYNTNNGGGLKHTGGMGFPGTTAYDKSQIPSSQMQKIMSGDPKTAQALDSFIAGQEVTDQDPEATAQPTEQEPAAASPEVPQPEVPLTTSQDPQVQMELDLVRANLEKLKGDNENGSFISAKGGFWNNVFKRFNQTGIYSGSFASKIDQAKIPVRSADGLQYMSLPPELAVKGSQTFNKFLSTAYKVFKGSATREDLLEIKDYIVIAKNKKGIMLRFDRKSRDGMIINWDTTESMFAVLVNEYERKTEAYTKTKKEIGTPDEFKLEERDLTGGGKSYNNLRGTTGEKFPAISTILLRGLNAAQACVGTTTNSRACKDAEKNKQLALQMIKNLYEDSRESLIPAFDVVDNFLHQEVPGTKATQELVNEVTSIMDFLKIELPRKMTEGVTTPEDIQIFSKAADALLDKVIPKLLRVDAKTTMVRSPLFIGETGQSSANSKKTDLTEVYESKDIAMKAMAKMGYDPVEAEGLLVPFSKVLEMYGGVETYSKITNTPIDKILELAKGKKYTLLNGIKTYLEEGDVSLGTGSVGEAYKKMSDINNKSISTFAKMLGIDRKELQATQKSFVDSYTFLETLKNPQNLAGKDRSALIKAVQDHLASKGLSKSYQGLTRGSQDEIAATITSMQQNLLFDQYDDLIKSNPKSANDFMSMIIMSAAAADTNQQTEARFLQNYSTYSFNHNESVSGPLKMVQAGQAKFVRKKGEATIRVIDNEGNVLLKYNTANEGSVVGGAVHLPLQQMRKISKKRSTAVNASTDLIVKFLVGQKNLLEQLLSRYQ